MSDRPRAGSAAVRPFVLAHLSDLHATAVELSSPRDVMGKRALGWLSWRRKRRKEHLAAVLEALIADLQGGRPDHVGVTGDLTHLGLPGEVEAAVAWLARLGPPERVSVVPGNHDAYAGAAGAERWAAWSAYMGDGGAAAGADGADDEAATRGFPFLRRVGAVALIGCSSARPTAPLLATGRLGDGQRARLEALLARLGEEGAFRVLLLHHPPVPAGQSRRRQLDDAAALRALLARTGAELVLHGHTHESHLATLPGPRGPIPVVGVPSSSAIGPRAARRARYHLYRIAPGANGDHGPLSWEVRGFDPASGRFVSEAHQRFPVG